MLDGGLNKLQKRMRGRFGDTVSLTAPEPCPFSLGMASKVLIFFFLQLQPDDAFLSCEFRAFRFASSWVFASYTYEELFDG